MHLNHNSSRTSHMIGKFSASTLAAAALLVVVTGTASATELQREGADVRGACYSDGRAGCRPLRSASTVRVIYGPSIPMYLPSEPSYPVDHGPELSGPTPEAGIADYGYVVPGDYGYFAYGGGARRRHHFRDPRHFGHHQHGGPRSSVVRGNTLPPRAAAPARQAPRAIHAGGGPRPSGGSRPAMGGRAGRGR
jgi:hypothetical protein